SERLRSFKRELTFFRLIRQHLGERDDIARLYEVQMEQPPYFLESEYVPGGNLQQWSERHGSMGAFPLSFRVRLLAQIARAVAAAHSLGIIHKDLKPSNVLIAETLTTEAAVGGPTKEIAEQKRTDGTTPTTADAAPMVRPRLCDFGIGVLADRKLLAEHQITE